MSNLTLTEAFAEYGATLRNRLYDYSAIADDGSVVVSCWAHLIKREGPGWWRYEIRDFSAWSGNGKNLLVEHLEYAIDEDQPIRLVMATPKDGAKPKVAGTDGQKIPKTISIRKDFVGKVLTLNADYFTIDFFRNKQPT